MICEITIKIISPYYHHKAIGHYQIISVATPQMYLIRLAFVPPVSGSV